MTQMHIFSFFLLSKFIKTVSEQNSLNLTLGSISSCIFRKRVQHSNSCPPPQPDLSSVGYSVAFLSTAQMLKRPVIISEKLQRFGCVRVLASNLVQTEIYTEIRTYSSFRELKVRINHYKVKRQCD